MGKNIDARALMKRPEKDPPLNDGDLSADEIGACLSTTHQRAKFEKTGNPIFAMLALQESYKAGLYPPSWVLDWLANGFEEYTANIGGEKLEDCMGFPQGRGKTSPFKSIMETQRDEMLLFDVYRLRCFLGITIDVAAQHVAERLKREDWNKTSLKLSNISGATIADKYKRGYGREIEADKSYRERFMQAWTKSEKVQFLKRFNLEFEEKEKDEITRLLSMAWR